MATQKQVTEPATPAATVPNAEKVSEEIRGLDPRRKVYVYDTRTGRKYDAPVPETHLAIFPHLREVASKKKGN